MFRPLMDCGTNSVARLSSSHDRLVRPVFLRSPVPLWDGRDGSFLYPLRPGVQPVATSSLFASRRRGHPVSAQERFRPASLPKSLPTEHAGRSSKPLCGPFRRPSSAFCPVPPPQDYLCSPRLLPCSTSIILCVPESL